MIRILGGLTDSIVDAFMDTVAARVSGDDGSGDVHHIPKLAIDRYMCFAGLVNDNVGVTYYQKLLMKRYMSTSIEDLEENICSLVLVNILFLFWVFVQMNLRCGIFRWVRCFMRNVYDFVTK